MTTPELRCPCGRRIDGQWPDTWCEGCEAKSDHCTCEMLPGERSERSETGRPDVPAPTALIYRGIVGEMTLAAAETSEADPVGIHGSLLAGISADLGPTPHVRIGNTRHPLLIWALLFGRTSTGRKGDAKASAEMFLKRACQDFASYATAGLSSGEGLIERIRDPAGSDEGVRDKRLFVTETEFGITMARARREGSSLAGVLRQAWDGDALSVMNRKQLTASSSHVAILGHITPKEFRRRVAEVDMAGGTFNRFLPLYVERSKRLPIPKGMDEEAVALLSAKLKTSLTTARTTAAIRLGDEARTLWCDELYDEFTEYDDEDAAWAQFTARAAPYCQRIAAIYAVLDGRAAMSKDDLSAAGALVRYSMASARYVLSGLTIDPQLDRLKRGLSTAGKQGLTGTQISALFGRHLPAAAIQDMLADLEASAYAEMVPVSTAGRTAKTWRRTSFA